MTRWKRLFYYLLINIIVSASTMLLVLYLWNRYYVPPEQAPLVVSPTPVPTGTPAPDTSDDTIPVETTGDEQATTITYRVQPGDTLSGIAFEFETTVDEILALNDLENPDSLSVGDELLLPVTEPGAEDASAPSDREGASTSTPPPRPSPPSLTLPPQGTPDPTPEVIDIEIIAVIGAGSLEDERVVIRYNGEGELILDGWRLEDSLGNSYTFPNLTLFMDGAITVYTKAGTDSVIELFWGLSQSVWEAGDVVTIIDPSGTIQTAYQLP